MIFSFDAVEARESACQTNYRTEAKAVHSIQPFFVEVYSRGVDESPSSRHKMKLRGRSGDGSLRVGGCLFELGSLLGRAVSSGIGQGGGLLKGEGEVGGLGRRMGVEPVRRRLRGWDLISFGGLKGWKVGRAL